MVKRSKKYKIFFNQSAINQIETLENNNHKGNIDFKNDLFRNLPEIQLKSSSKNYTIEIPDITRSFFDIGFNLKNLLFSNNKISFKLDMFTSKYSNGNIYGEVYRIRSTTFKSNLKKYYKLIIPLNEKKIDFLYQLSRYGYASENDNHISTNATSFNIGNENFFIIIEKKDDKSYLIVHSEKRQIYNDFSKKCHSILICLGYITGHYISDKGYYFTYNTKKMDVFTSYLYRTLRDGMKNFWQPINSNAYSWVDSRNPKRAEKIYKKYNLRTLNKSEFSKLCSLCIENDDFLSVLFLILESNDASLVFRPGGYSIALETLSNIISSKSKIRQKPITSKEDCKKFQNDLYAVLDKYKDFDSFKDIETLKGKIEYINQMTNQEKLTAPFKELGINISKEDLEVVKSRNAFLHGRVPDFRNLGKNRTIEEKDADLYYASAKLYTLLNLLILKYIGYDSYVLNFSKLYEQKTKYPIKEDYYRK
ncbi:hypothetical protein ACFO4P_06430 [Epilithonimonas pallida]|uniref:ApeA N-terminal domain-containing protein n=1 Tax=Epilithonimonas pallida TaxID=373671 RepID=A0ABY1R5R6_9FLAO|nr:hypothetical protein SAMN05421679_109102 [Epilithonimonas pallida]